jgi:hypothetical protein
MSKDKIIKLENQVTNIEWTSYKATAYAEGFCEGEGASLVEQLEAWACLIKTGMCWSLQGWFGRAASSLIERNMITKEGVINWGNIDTDD